MSSVPLSEEDLKREYDILSAAVHCHLCPKGEGVERKPGVLQPGLHPVCAACLESHSSSSSSSSSTPIPTSCLRCQGVVWDMEVRKLTQNDVLHLQYHLERLDKMNKKLISLKTPQKNERCDLCESFNKRDASVRCLECKQNLCNDCNNIHVKFWSSHNSPDFLVPLESNNSSHSSSSCSSHLSLESSSLPKSKCPDHPSEKLNLMCLKCEVPICSFCFFDGAHQDHNTSPIFKIIGQKKEKLSGLVSRLNGRHKDLEKSLSSLDVAETKIQESLISQKAKILKKMEDLRIKAIQKIDQKQDRLLNELETKSNTKLERLAQQRKRLEADLSCLENSVKVSRSFLKNASDDQFCSHLRLLSDQLTRLNEDENLLQLPVEIKVLELDEGQPIDLDDLLKGIKLTEKQSQDISQALKDLKMFSFAQITAKAPPRDYNSIRSPSLVFGSKGTEDGQFNTPRRCAIDKDNRIIVCDTKNHRIQIFDHQGNHIKSFGSKGSSDGKFENPSGIEVDLNNRIIVCDINNHRIQIFDDQGNHLKSFGSKGTDDGQFNFPQSVAIDLNNRIIICDYGNHRIQIFDDQGNHLKTFGSKGSNDGQFEDPLGITIDKRTNNILVGDMKNFRIQIFDDQGNHIKSFGSQGSSDGQFMASAEPVVDQHGNIVVTDWGNDRVQVFDDQGNFITKFGSKGSLPDQFLSPQGITFDHLGRIIVCDVNNHRIQIFG